MILYPNTFMLQPPGLADREEMAAKRMSSRAPTANARLWSTQCGRVRSSNCLTTATT